MDTIRLLIQEVETLKGNKKYDEALSKLEKSISKYSDDYRLFEEIADIYLYMGDIEKALKAINFALTLNPESATGNYLKGFIYLSDDKIKVSIEFLEKSNILMPNNAEVLRNLGWAYNMTGNGERGIIVLKRALNLSPGDNLIAEDLAMALIGTGNISEGNVILKKLGKNIVK